MTAPSIAGFAPTPLAGSAKETTACSHCGLPVPRSRLVAEEKLQFCCDGCFTVYTLISQNGLDDYYGYRERYSAEPAAAKVTDRSYADFDDPAFRTLYCRAAENGLSTTELYLEGVHCSACVWLVERLPRVRSGVVEVRLDITRSVARALDSLGYPPHALQGQRRAAERTRQNRALVAKMAIAGAAAGNAMLMAFAMYGGMFAGMERQYAELFRWGSLLIALPAVTWSASVFYKGAWAALRTRTPHMDLPVSLGIGIGFIGGALNTWLGHGEIYFDTITILIFLLLVGRWIQNRQHESARDAAELLHSLAPSTARLVDGDEVRDVPAATLTLGSIIEVRASEHIAADGEIVSGTSSLDCSLLTGEARPEEVSLGSRVHAGTINLTSPLRIAVQKSGADTRVGQLMKRVEEAAERRAPIVRLADRISGVFVLCTLSLALVTLGVWLWISPTHAIDHAVALLVVTCPCALGMATPLAASVALGRAARSGILVKGADALEQLAEPGLFVFDKTGTLTRGELSMLRWQGDESLKPLVRAAEAQSAHPIAHAFVRGLGEQPELEVSGLDQTLGGGLVATVAGRQLIVGSASYVRARATVPPWVETAIADFANAVLTPVLIAADGEVRALAGFGDPVRADAAESLTRLRELGHDVMILSGDHPDVVRAVARTLSVPDDAALGGVAPEEKLGVVERARQNRRVFMVGDGINDAAALSAANVGIAVHGGAEASLAAADVFLRRAGVAPVVELARGARRTMAVIRRGLAFSLVYNAIGVGLALAGVLNPLLAAILMPISSLTVVTSSFRSRTFEGNEP